MNKRREGFSLVEVVISMTVLALVAAGIGSVTMMTSKVAYSNIYENTAYNIAQAYAEQIKSISYQEISNALSSPAEHDIPTESLQLGLKKVSGDLKIADPLIFGLQLEKKIVVDVEENADGTFSEKLMTMRVLPTGNDLRQETSCWDAIEITLDFEWEVIDQNGVNLKSGQIKLVKSSVADS